MGGCTNMRCSSAAGRRAGLCSQHARADCLFLDKYGLEAPVRWCYKCNRLQPVKDFEGASRVCEKNRIRVNQRRRADTSSHASDPRSCVEVEALVSSHADKDDVLLNGAAEPSSVHSEGDSCAGWAGSGDGTSQELSMPTSQEMTHWLLQDIAWDPSELVATLIDPGTDQKERIGLLPQGGPALLLPAKRNISKASPRGCQAGGCSQVLLPGSATPSQLRARLCAEHIVAPEISVGGLLVRYCQKCRTCEPLECFNGGRHTCQKKLNLYFQRKHGRLPAAAAVVPAVALTGTAASCALGGVRSAAPTASSSPWILSGDDLETDPALLDELLDFGDKPSPPHEPLASDAEPALPTPAIASLKLHDLAPTMLPSGLHTLVSCSFDQISGACIHKMEGYVQPGCTLLTFQVLLSQALGDVTTPLGSSERRSASAAEVLARALEASTLVLGGRYDVYLEGEKVSVRPSEGDGERVGSAVPTPGPPRLPPLRPLAVLRTAPSMVCGTALPPASVPAPAAAYPISASVTGASDAGQRPAITAGFHGHWLRVAAERNPISAWRMTLPAFDDGDGVLMLAAASPSDPGVVTPAVPVLLTADPGVANEFQQLGEAADASGPERPDMQARAERLTIAVGHVLHEGSTCPRSLFVAALAAVTRLDMPATRAALMAAAAAAPAGAFSEMSEAQQYIDDWSELQHAPQTARRQGLRLATQYVIAAATGRRSAWRRLMAAAASGDALGLAVALRMKSSPRAEDLRLAMAKAKAALRRASEDDGIFLPEHLKHAASELLLALATGATAAVPRGGAATASAGLCIRLLRAKQAAVGRRYAEEVAFRAWLAKRAFTNKREQLTFIGYVFFILLFSALVLRAFLAGGGMSALAEAAKAVAAAPAHLSVVDVLSDDQLRHFFIFNTLCTTPLRLLAVVLLTLGIVVRPMRPWFERNHQALLAFFLISSSPPGCFTPHIATAIYGRNLGMMSFSTGIVGALANTVYASMGVYPLSNFTTHYFIIKTVVPFLVLAIYYAGLGELRVWVLRHPLGALCNATTSALAAHLVVRREQQLRLQFASSVAAGGRVKSKRS